MFASASCLNILPLNQMIADFLPTKHIFTKPGPSFNKNRAVWCPLPSKHASSPIYLWGALYWIQTDHECYPALYKTSHGIGNLIQGFKWIATLPVWSASIFFFFHFSIKWHEEIVKPLPSLCLLQKNCYIFILPFILLNKIKYIVFFIENPGNRLF